MVKSFSFSLILFSQQVHCEPAVHFHTVKRTAQTSPFLLGTFQKPPHKNVEKWTDSRQKNATFPEDSKHDPFDRVSKIHEAEN